MRKLKIFSLILTIFLLLGATAFETAAQDEMPPDDQPPPMERHRRPRLLEELNLKPEQIQQIRRINQARRPLMHEAQKRFHDANRALDQVIYAPSPNEADIQTKMKEVQLAQAEIIKIRTASEVAVSKVLTPEQLEKFRELREQFMRRMHNRPNRQTMDEPSQRDVDNPKNRDYNQPRRRRGF
jgi:Spy/CpxP family protein refolding chaperone